jgi:hypothetical protein
LVRGAHVGSVKELRHPLHLLPESVGYLALLRAEWDAERDGPPLAPREQPWTSRGAQHLEGSVKLRAVRPRRRLNEQPGWTDAVGSPLREQDADPHRSAACGANPSTGPVVGRAVEELAAGGFRRRADHRVSKTHKLTASALRQIPRDDPNPPRAVSPLDQAHQLM